MSKEYRYHRGIFWGQFLIPALYAFLIAALWVFVSRGLSSSVPVSRAALAAKIPVTAVLAAYCGVLWLLYYRLAGVRVRLEEDAIVYRSRRGERRIPYDRIDSIRGRASASLLGGWLIVASEGKKTRVTFALAEIGAFSIALKEAMDQRGLSDRYDEGNLLRFIRVAVLGDASLVRFREQGARLLVLTVVATTLAALLGWAMGRGVLGMIGLAMIGAAWPLLSIGVAELVLARYDRKRAEKDAYGRPTRNPLVERKVYRAALAIAVVTYVFAFFLFLGLMP